MNLLVLWGLIRIWFQIDKASQKISYSLHDLQTEEIEDEDELYHEKEDDEDDEEDDASEISTDDEN